MAPERGFEPRTLRLTARWAPFRNWAPDSLSAAVCQCLSRALLYPRTLRLTDGCTPFRIGGPSSLSAAEYLDLPSSIAGVAVRGRHMRFVWSSWAGKSAPAVSR